MWSEEISTYSSGRLEASKVVNSRSDATMVVFICLSDVRHCYVTISIPSSGIFIWWRKTTNLDIRGNQSGSKWVKVGQSGSKWVRVDQSVLELLFYDIIMITNSSTIGFIIVTPWVANPHPTIVAEWHSDHYLSTLTHFDPLWFTRISRFVVFLHQMNIPPEGMEMVT